MQAYSSSSDTNSDLQVSTALYPVDLWGCNQGDSNKKKYSFSVLDAVYGVLLCLLLKKRYKLWNASLF